MVSFEQFMLFPTPLASLFLRSLLNSLPNLQLPRLLVNQHEFVAFTLRLNTTESYVFLFSKHRALRFAFYPLSCSCLLWIFSSSDLLLC